MTLEEILASRRTGVFYLGDDERLASKIARVMTGLGYTPEQVGQVAEALFVDQEQRGEKMTLRRTTKAELDVIRATAKQTERKFNPATQEWTGGDIDQGDFVFCRLAHAIVDPEVPGGTLREKADWLSQNLSMPEANELLAACHQLDSFNLERARALVKN